MTEFLSLPFRFFRLNFYLTIKKDFTPVLPFILWETLISSARLHYASNKSMGQQMTGPERHSGIAICRLIVNCHLSARRAKRERFGVRASGIEKDRRVHRATKLVWVISGGSWENPSLREAHIKEGVLPITGMCDTKHSFGERRHFFRDPDQDAGLAESAY